MSRASDLAKLFGTPKKLNDATRVFQGKTRANQVHGRKSPIVWPKEMRSSHYDASTGEIVKRVRKAASGEPKAPRVAKPKTTPLERAWAAWKVQTEADPRAKYGGSYLVRFMQEARRAGLDPSVVNLDFEAKHPRHPAGSPGGTGGEFAPKDGNWRVTSEGRVIRRVKK